MKFLHMNSCRTLTSNLTAHILLLLWQRGTAHTGREVQQLDAKASKGWWMDSRQGPFQAAFSFFGTVWWWSSSSQMRPLHLALVLTTSIQMYNFGVPAGPQCLHAPASTSLYWDSSAWIWGLICGKKPGPSSLPKGGCTQQSVPTLHTSMCSPEGLSSSLKPFPVRSICFADGLGGTRLPRALAPYSCCVYTQGIRQNCSVSQEQLGLKTHFYHPACPLRLISALKATSYPMEILPETPEIGWVWDGLPSSFAEPWGRNRTGIIST